MKIVSMVPWRHKKLRAEIRDLERRIGIPSPEAVICEALVRAIGQNTWEIEEDDA